MYTRKLKEKKMTFKYFNIIVGAYKKINKSLVLCYILKEIAVAWSLILKDNIYIYSDWCQGRVCMSIRKKKVLSGVLIYIEFYL